MRILISGICGFVGSTLARDWIATEPESELFGIDNLSRRGSERNLSELQRLGIRIFHGDLRNASDLEALPAVDWVIDAAANPSVLAGVDGQSSSRQLIEHNLLGTINLLEYCKRQSAGFILLSTSRVYSLSELGSLPLREEKDRLTPDLRQPLPAGIGREGISENFSTAPPLSLYGSSKLASEILALDYGAAFNFPVWINRCGALAGAGQFGRPDQGILAFWINSWLRRRPLTYLGFGGRGQQVRDFLHPRDLLSLLLCQVKTETKGQTRIFNLGGGETRTLSLAELSHWCAVRFGRHEIASAPQLRQYDLPWIVMDTTLARNIWNWQPRTALDQLLEEIAIHAEEHPDWLTGTGQP